jgi:2-polyprenyl-3-methyl-5-hydroxy-6-metoxy-1,4-benzoquinol methylase
MISLVHNDAVIEIEDLHAGEKKIWVKPKDDNLKVLVNTCTTGYPIELIKKILEIKGPDSLCDEIIRDESPGYVQEKIRNGLLSYLSESELSGKRILDFGCGSGASTVILSRLIPFGEIVGIELERDLLDIAKMRAEHYGQNNIRFILSPDANNLPNDIGKFDLILLNAVFEHFLPAERNNLLPKIWKTLKTNGVLFMTETPNRVFPIELNKCEG